MKLEVKFKKIQGFTMWKLERPPLWKVCAFRMKNGFIEKASDHPIFSKLVLAGLVNQVEYVRDGIFNSFYPTCWLRNVQEFGGGFFWRATPLKVQAL